MFYIAKSLNKINLLITTYLTTLVSAIHLLGDENLQLEAICAQCPSPCDDDKSQMSFSLWSCCQIYLRALEV